MTAEVTSPWAHNRIRLVVTDDCDINCFYCHNEGHAKGTQLLPADLFSHLISTIDIGGVQLNNIAIVGGEPLLHPALDDFITRLKRVAEKVSITTNGVQLTSERIALLAQAGCNDIRVGADSLSRARSRPSHGMVNPRAVTEIIADIQSYGMRAEMNVVLTHFNRREISDIVQFCIDRKIDVKFFEHVYISKFAKGSENARIATRPFVPFSEFDATIRTAYGVDDHFEDLAGANSVYLMGDTEIRYCRYLHDYARCSRSGTRVGPNGYVSVCMEQSEALRISSDESPQQSISIVRSALNQACEHRQSPDEA